MRDTSKGSATLEFVFGMTFVLIAFLVICSLLIFNMIRISEAYQVYRVSRVSSVIGWENTVNIRDKYDLYSLENYGDNFLSESRYGDLIGNSLESSFNISILKSYIEPIQESTIPESLYNAISNIFGKEKADSLKSAWPDIYEFLNQEKWNIPTFMPEDLKNQISKKYGEETAEFLDSIWETYISKYLTSLNESLDLIFVKLKEFNFFPNQKGAEATIHPTLLLIKYNIPVIKSIFQNSYDFFYWQCPGRPIEYEDKNFEDLTK
ncbi:MAG: hypothetical protein QW735_02980 [archaeon]